MILKDVLVMQMNRFIFLIFGLAVPVLINFNICFSQTPGWEWAKSLDVPQGVNYSSSGRVIKSDAMDNLYVSGNFYGTIDFDPGPDTSYLTSIGEFDVFIAKYDQSGNFVWVKSIAYSGINYIDCLSFDFDASDNIYLTGYFRGRIDFDPDTTTYTMFSAIQDMYILKMDSSGSYKWAKQISGNGQFSEAKSIAIDAASNIYLTGNFEGTCDFDPGTGIYNLTSSSSYNSFILKIDSSGSFIWAKSFDGTASVSSGKSVSIDDSGNVYTSGVFFNTIDFDPGQLSFPLTSLGNSDIFISKLDSAGNFIWAKSVGGTNLDENTDMVTDAYGNIYLTGYFMGISDFDPGLVVYNLTSAGSQDLFVLKLNALGNLQWANGIGGTFPDKGMSIEVDNIGCVYTTGFFIGSVDFDYGPGNYVISGSPSAPDFFVLKLLPGGNFDWVKSSSGGGAAVGNDLNLNSSNLINLLAEFSGTSLILDTYTLNNAFANGNIMFLAQLNNTTGVDFISENKSVLIYPNPADKFININVPDSNNPSVVRIYNLTGKIIFESICNSGSFNLEISDLTSGIYIIEIEVDFKKIQKKLVVN